jgi:hypothetical protein
MKKQLLVNAAIAGIVAAGTMSVGQVAFAKGAEKGLCSNASACGGKGACGETKGKNDCKGKGNAMMTKAACEKLAKKDKGADHNFMAAPKKDM